MITLRNASLPTIGVFKKRNCSHLTAWHGSLTYARTICKFYAYQLALQLSSFLIPQGTHFTSEILVPIVDWPQIIRHSIYTIYIMYITAPHGHMGKVIKQNTNLTIFFKKSLVNIFLEYLWLKILFLHIGDLSIRITSFCINSKLVRDK